MTEYSVKPFDLLSDNEKIEFYNFCKAASQETKDPACENMWNHNNPNDSRTIKHKLENTDIFNGIKGRFFILYCNNTIVGCSGIYQSPFSSDIYLAGSRTWIHKEFRNLSLNKKYLFPIQRSWAIERQCKLIALTFNDYNKNIIEIFKRNRLGETNNRVGNRSSLELFYNGFRQIDFPIWLNYTKQWVCYEPIDSYFTFNWESIRYNNSD